MGYRYASAGGVIDGEYRKILHQGATAPDVEKLQTEADREDGFIEVMGVLNKEFIYVLASAVGWRALGDRFLAVFLRVDVGGASWEEDGLAGVDEIGDGGGGGVDWNFDWKAAASLNGCGVLRPGALVVGEVSASRDGNGDAGLHGRLIIRLTAVFHVEHLGALAVLGVLGVGG
jgi:hypothetical protein